MGMIDSTTESHAPGERNVHTPHKFAPLFLESLQTFSFLLLHFLNNKKSWNCDI